MTAADATWWRQAVVYQVYPRSFADSDGDGIRDLRGVASRVPYLRELGVDAVWLSPFYPSPMVDGGYDVADYRDVHPALGTLADFEALRDALREAGIRLIVDIVPNHSSSEHPWFKEALASPPGSPARERYHFRDGIGPGGDQPPSDWVSHFGGSAWERVIGADGHPEQWYLHLFAPEQPDWNWDHPDVRQDFRDTIRFWGDRGVDGFRVDVAYMLVKDMTEPLRSKPTLADELTQFDGKDPIFDREEVHEIYQDWRTVFDEYDPPLMGVAEAWVPAHRRAAYARPTELGQAFNFDLLLADWNVDRFADSIMNNLEQARASGSSSTWVLSNHDVVRHATRYGLPHGTDTATWLLGDGADPAEDREFGLRRAHAATLLMLALPGSAYLYQGEELGLFEVADIPRDRLEDPIWVRAAGQRKGRDGCRVPLPWSLDGPSLGFGPGDAHLPQPDWFRDHAADTAPPTLRLYRDALRLRRELLPDESLRWLGREDDEVLHFVRGDDWQCVTNFGTVPVELPDGDVLLASAPLEEGRLPGDATAWVRGEVKA